MYSFLEIEFIFKNCLNWSELSRTCEAFLLLIQDGDLSFEKRMFISEQSDKRFREIENI